MEKSISSLDNVADAVLFAAAAERKKKLGKYGTIKSQLQCPYCDCRPFGVRELRRHKRTCKANPRAGSVIPVDGTAGGQSHTAWGGPGPSVPVQVIDMDICDEDGNVILGTDITAGFDPSEERDSKGEWTKGGDGAGGKFAQGFGSKPEVHNFLKKSGWAHMGSTVVPGHGSGVQKAPEWNHPVHGKLWVGEKKFYHQRGHMAGTPVTTKGVWKGPEGAAMGKLFPSGKPPAIDYNKVAEAVPPAQKVPDGKTPAGGPGSVRHKILADVLPAGTPSEEAKARPIHPTWKWPKSWKQQAYGGVVVNEQGQFLIREPAGHFDGYHFTWPKGKMNDKNEHPVDVATREVQEETGRKVRVIDAIPGTYKSGSGSHTNMFMMRSAGIVQPIRGQISDLTAFDTLKTLGRIQL
jgi:hypothetical protein